MSFHGQQNIFPMFYLKEDLSKAISLNEELSISFYLLTHDLKENEKIKSFSRLLVPMVFIQGLISTHIVLEGLSIASFDEKITNPPRQALIGHILRNIENRSQVELLEKIIAIITYKDEDAKQLSSLKEEEEEAEFKKVNIKYLLNPGLIEGLKKILPRLKYMPMRDYTVLDSSLITELALDLAEYYRNTIKLLKGNAMRWQNLIKLIDKEINKWLLDLKVKRIDVKGRYDSEIGKMNKVIDSSIINERIKEEKDKIDLWVQIQKKRLIEAISQQFMTVDRKILELASKNKFFTNYDALKAFRLQEVISKCRNHIGSLNENIQYLSDLVKNISTQVDDFVKRSEEINQKATKRLEDKNKNLGEQLSKKDEMISTYQREKEFESGEIKNLKNNIKNKAQEIKDIILRKSEDCLREAKILENQNIKDNEALNLSMPVIWTFFPLYMGLIEDEKEFEEKIKIILPGFINRNALNAKSLKEELNPSYTSYLQNLLMKIEEDMKIRSNFEFSGENNNLLEDSNIKKQIQNGISSLISSAIINDVLAKEMEEKLNFIS